MNYLLRGLITAALAACPCLVQAQAYPNKPVKIILPFAAGGASDVMARVLADELRSQYNQPFIIDYKAGASGRIGAEALVKSAPDGYTLFIGTNSIHSANPFLFKKLNYDPIKDFSPISYLVTYSSVLVTSPGFPVSNVSELAEYAKANPGKVSYAYGNTIAQLGCAGLFHTVNAPVIAVSYKSNTQAATDVIAGVATVTVVDLASSSGLIKSGKLKALAGVRGKRSSLLPDLPVVAETPGFEGFDINSWVALFGPAGLPRPIVDSLNNATRKVLTKQEIKDRFAQASAELEPSTPDELAIFMTRQLDNWGRRIRDAGIQPE